MNADRARPLVAFWALAVLAGVITTMGLREGSTRVEVPIGVPSAVTGSGSPELVLGGLLTGQPSATSTGQLSNAWTSAAALEHALDLASARAGGEPTSHAVVAGPKVGVPTDASAVASARASSSPSRPGNAHPGSGHGTATAATAKPTHPSPSKAPGRGHPQSSAPGKD